VARDLIKSHLLTLELSAELFAQKGIGGFSAAFIEWSQSKLKGLQKSGYKRIKTHGTYHGQSQILYTVCDTYPNAEGGHECPLPSGVLTQALLQHSDQCMRHEDVVK